MCRALIDPPYEFVADEYPLSVVEAVQLMQDVFLMLTLKPLAFVAPHELSPVPQAYAPTCRALIEPP
jgi:hypothetical protein